MIFRLRLIRPETPKPRLCTLRLSEQRSLYADTPTTLFARRDKLAWPDIRPRLRLKLEVEALDGPIIEFDLADCEVPLTVWADVSFGSLRVDQELCDGWQTTWNEVRNIAIANLRSTLHLDFVPIPQLGSQTWLVMGDDWTTGSLVDAQYFFKPILRRLPIAGSKPTNAAIAVDVLSDKTMVVSVAPLPAVPYRFDPT